MLTEDVPEEKNPVLERGTMIHEYLLQPEEFQKHYVVWDKGRPLSAQQEKFCQVLASSLEIEPNKAIINAYKEAYSTTGKTDEKMLSEGTKIVSTLKDYIDFLRQNDGRIIISVSEAKMLDKIKYNIEHHHKLAGELLKPKNNYQYETHHEFHINWVYYIEKAAGVDCKSLLDSLSFDFIEKIVTIMDLKTTAKLWRFEESIQAYDYLRQLDFYKKAVMWYLKEELNEDVNDWQFDFYIIGIDTTGSSEIRVFRIEESMIQSRDECIHNALVDISWHQSTGKWNHSREYYEGDGSEKLKL